MHDRPTAAELLAIMADTLSDVVVPATEPHARHQARVAANLCRVLAREVLAREVESHGQFEVPLAALAQSLAVEVPVGCSEHDQLELIAAAIMTADDATADDIHDDVEALVRAKLDVAKPGYDRHHAAAEAEVVA